MSNKKGVVHHCDCGEWVSVSATQGNIVCPNCGTTMKKMEWEVTPRNNKYARPEQ